MWNILYKDAKVSLSDYLFFIFNNPYFRWTWTTKSLTEEKAIHIRK